MFLTYYRTGSTSTKSINAHKKINKRSETVNTQQLEKEIYNYLDYSSIFLPQTKTLKIKINNQTGSSPI